MFANQTEWGPASLDTNNRLQKSCDCDSTFYGLSGLAGWRAQVYFNLMQYELLTLATLSLVCHLFLEQDELHLPFVLGQFFMFFERVFELCLACADRGAEVHV
jgi:hypothetical protein